MICSCTLFVKLIGLISLFVDFAHEFEVFVHQFGEDFAIHVQDSR